MESDADRLATIQSVDGVPVYSDELATFFAIFDRQYSSVSAGDLEIESRSPALVCRSSDAKDVTKDMTLMLGGSVQSYRLLRAEPDTPAPGWTTLVLRS